MEDVLRKSLIKIEIKMLRMLLFVMAFFHFLNTVLSYVGYNDIYISNMFGIGTVPLFYIIFSSHTYGFCLYHRLFAYYIGVNNAICFIDYNYELPISDRRYLLLHIIVAFIFLSAIVYLKLKHGKRIKESYNKSY